MGYWLWKIFKSKGLTDQAIAGTDIFLLPKQGIISNLLMEFQPRSGSENQDIFVADAVTKVEVIGNGSTVICSLDGRQIQASMAHDDLKMPPDKEYSPSGGCWGYFDIRFGRYPGDQKYALDCSKWDSLELKVTYDLAAGGTIGTSGFTTTTAYVSIYGLYSPDGAGLAPVGFIKKAEKKTYTTAYENDEDLALPTDYPYRRLLLFAETHACYTYQAFQYVTIDVNNGARKPIDNMLGDDLMIMGLAIQGNPLWTHTKRYYVVSGAIQIHPPIRWIKNAHWVIYKGYGMQSLDPNQLVISGTATGWEQITVQGYSPWGSLIIDLERQSGKDGREAMEDCWGFDQKADIHLKHTQIIADKASSIVLEQYATPPA